jgi:hypothetical protein
MDNLKDREFKSDTFFLKYLIYLLYLKFIIGNRGSLFGYTTPNTNKHHIKVYMKIYSDFLFINNLYYNIKNAFCSNNYALLLILL